MNDIKVRFNLNTILLAMIGFFATWGEGMQLLIPRASLIYPALVIVYIVFNLKSFVNALRGGTIVPKEFKLLFLFITLHTLIYLFLNINSISFGVESGSANDEGFSYGKSSDGITIVRYFLFLLFCLYTTIDFSNKNKLFVFSFFYVLGFISTILGGAFHSYSNALIRFSGGLQDPNAMAFDALVAFVFSLYLFVSNKEKKLLRVIIIFSFVIELVAVFLSFSRGAYLALATWGLLYMVHNGLSKYFGRILFGLVVFYVLGNLTVKTLQIDTDLVRTRFSLKEVKDNKGEGRELIWSAYLNNIEDYFVLGKGICNSPSVLKNNREGVSELYETHNLYLQFFVEFGIVGLLLYLYYWRVVIRNTRRSKGVLYILISMGILMMVVTFFLNIDKGRTFWIVLAVINMVCMENNKNKLLIKR